MLSASIRSQEAIVFTSTNKIKEVTGIKNKSGTPSIKRLILKTKIIMRIAQNKGQ
jgi:hypothetical protein